MGMFGWSLPPGVHNTPFDQDDGVTELQEKVLELLEAAGIPTEVNDQIMKLISDAEVASIPAEPCEEYPDNGPTDPWQTSGPNEG